MKNLLVVSLLAAYLSSLVTAEEGAGFFVGTGFGVSDYDEESFYQQQQLDDSASGGKFYGGYRFNHYVSVEGALLALGTFDADSFSAKVENDFSVLSVAVLGNLPLAYGFSLFGQLGVGMATISQEISYASPSGQLFTGDDDDSAGTSVYGVGVKLIPPKLPRIEFRLSWERYNFSVNTIRIENNTRIKDGVDTELDLYLLGIAYNF